LNNFSGILHPRPQAQARAALTVALGQAQRGQAVDLRRNSDAEAWSHSICIPVALLPKNMATAMNANLVPRVLFVWPRAEENPGKGCENNPQFVDYFVTWYV
jgi:hypothetical protein